MKPTRFTLLLTLCLLLGSLLCANALADGTITVTGTAVVALEPDYAQLSMGVETENAVVADAQAENARIMDAVIAALKAAGLADKDIKTTDFNVYSSYRYEVGPDGVQTSTLVYHVSNALRVTVRDLDKVGTYIDAAARAGANQINSLTFLSHDTKDAYTQALQEACADAQQKADTIAAALGVTIRGIEEVSMPEYVQAAPVFNNAMYARKTAAGAVEMEEADTAIIAGGLSVSANVQIVFEIK